MYMVLDFFAVGGTLPVLFFFSFFSFFFLLQAAVYNLEGKPLFALCVMFCKDDGRAIMAHLTYS